MRHVISNLDIGGRALVDGCVEEGEHRLDVVAGASSRVGAEKGAGEGRFGDGKLGRRHRQGALQLG